MLDNIKKFYKESQKNDKYHPIILHIITDIRPIVMLLLNIVFIIGHFYSISFLISIISSRLSTLTTSVQYNSIMIISVISIIFFLLMTKFIEKYVRIWIYISYKIANKLNDYIPIPNNLTQSGNMSDVFSMLDEIPELDMSEIESMSEMSEFSDEDK